jgi:hypothetical protein
MFVELVLTLWGKPRLGLPKKRGLVIKRAERDETARPGVRAGGFPLSREASSRLNVVQQNRFPRDARARPIREPANGVVQFKLRGIGHAPHCIARLA